MKTTLKIKKTVPCPSLHNLSCACFSTPYCPPFVFSSPYSNNFRASSLFSIKITRFWSFKMFNNFCLSTFKFCLHFFDFIRHFDNWTCTPLPRLSSQQMNLWIFPKKASAYILFKPILSTLAFYMKSWEMILNLVCE